MPRVVPIRKDSVYWWNDKIANLRKICYNARRRWQKAKSTGSIEVVLEREEVYRACRKDLRSEIKKAKASAWDDLIGTIERGPWGLPYRIVLKKLRRASPSLTETLALDTLDRIVNNLFPEDVHWNSGISADDDDEMWQEEYNVNMHELCNMLRKKSSANKAPGIDGIKSVFLKRIPEVFLKELTNIYNIYIRKGEFPYENLETLDPDFNPKRRVKSSDPKGAPYLPFERIRKNA